MSDQNPFSDPPQDNSNPYATGEMGDSSTPTAQRPASAGYIRQVPVLAILMMIQGGLVLLLGLFMGAMGFFMPAMIEQQMQQNPGFQQPPNMQGMDMETFMMLTYGGIGAVLTLIAVPTIISGFRLYKYRGRIMGIVSLSAGLLTVFACYCFPTALGLFIFGLIVLLNEPVRKAFELGNQGVSPAEIKQRLLGGP